MKNDDEQSSLILTVIGIIPVIWFALLVAPYLSSGLMGILDGVPEAMNHPFSIRLCGDSVKTVLIFLLAYGMGIGIYLSTKKHYRRGEEHGSAKWGNVKKINRRYREKRFTKNKLLTMHVRISYNMRKHLRNVLTVVIGGSGSGKTRFFAKPNLMQANTSFVVLDPKGENLRDTGYLLEEKGYEVRVLDLINMEKSHCYNPFVYLKDDNDVQRLVTNLFKATTPKGSQSNDPFWDTAASMLLLALIFYLRYEAPEEEQNFPMVSCYKKTIEEARTYFARVTTELNSHFARLGSKCAEVNGEDKLRILHDFYRTGEESDFHFDIQESMRKGHSFKDYICPDTFEFEKDYFRMGERYGRVLFLREYASYIKDDMIAELTDMNRNLMLSIDVIPVPTDEAVQEVEKRLLGVETNITNWQRRQNANNNFYLCLNSWIKKESMQRNVPLLTDVWEKFMRNISMAEQCRLCGCYVKNF